MTFAFSDLLGIAWILAFPILLHILNIFSGRNKGISLPPTESWATNYLKTLEYTAKSNRGDYKNPQIKVKHIIQVKPQIKPTPIIRAAPVTYTPQDKKPSVTLTRDWAPTCCILPTKPKSAPIQISAPIHVISKPAKFLKARKPRKSIIIKPDTEELKTIRMNAGYKLKLTWIEIAWLKTHAIRRGIDDWLSLIDSTLSYEENKLNLQTQYGAVNSDSELVQKYKNYSDMARAEYENN